MKKHIIFILSGCALLSSCHMYKDYERAENTPVEGLFRDTVSMTASLHTTDTTNFGNLPWREVFVEPQLQTLIEKALASNVDLRKAEMNIEKMKASVTISKLSYLPSIAVAPTAQTASFDKHKATQTYTIPISASWNLGSFGSLRNNRKQAKTNLAMTKAVKQATQTAIIAGVANLYYTLEMLDEQLRITKETIVLWKKNVDAMEAMMDAGMTTAAAVGQAKANYQELLASVPALESSIRQSENALCILLNENPHAIERGIFSADPMGVQVAVGLPMQLLSNRPDVQVAEYNLASNFYKLNIARSAFYPNLSLTGTVGWTNSAGGLVMNPAKLIANAVANVVQPIFSNGKLMANLKISKLDVEAAELDFQQALIKAGVEVSDALDEYQAAIKKQAYREEKVAELEKTVESTQMLFQYGSTTSYLETLTAQQSLLSGQLALINDKYAKVGAAISLYQALGGGRN